MTLAFPACFLIWFPALTSRFLFPWWKHRTEKIGNNTEETRIKCACGWFPDEETNRLGFLRRKHGRVLSVSSFGFLVILDGSLGWD